MKNKFLAIITVALISITAGTANAATTAKAKGPSFSGFYAGVDLGAGTDSPASTNDNNLAMTYDAFAGANLNVYRKWFAGLEGSIGRKNGQNYTLAADAKIGRQLVGYTLAYAKLGYANTNATYNGERSDFDGLRTGVGLETFLSKKVSARLEGIYTNYKTQMLGGETVDPTDVSVRAGVSYFF